MKPWIVGTEIKTQRGNMLTIVGSEPKIKGKEVIYLASCDVCNRDAEMFPDLFRLRRSTIKRGGYFMWM